MSETRDLAARVCAVMADVGNVEKDKTNEHFKYSYTSAEAVRSKVQKACAKHGVLLRIQYLEETVAPQQSVMKCTCSVSLDGVSWVLLGEGWGAGVDRGEKSPMKACTSAAKYAIANAFCIALGDDPEADAETDKAAAKGKRISAPLALEGEEADRARVQAIAGVHNARATQKSPERQLADGLIDHAKANVNDIDSLRVWLKGNAAAIVALPTRAISYVLGHISTHACKVVDGMNNGGFMDEFNAAKGAQS